MRIAITGGSGFVGRHLARRLAVDGHDVVSLARGVRHAGDEHPGIRTVQATISDPDALAAAFAGCDAVAHCAGINREIGNQTYARIHVDGTRHTVNAARHAGVRKIVMMSFLRARPDCGSPYHESKWAAEELIRESGLDYTIVKAGMTYGLGDHMLDHLSHSLFTLPLFATIGIREQPIRPLAIDDLVDMLRAAVVDGRLTRATVAATGAEELTLGEAVRRVARVLGRRVWTVPAPVWTHIVLAHAFEWMMTVPLVAKAQVRILTEGVVEAAPPCDQLPADLTATRRFTDDQIRAGLPAAGRFTVRDLRWCAR